MLISFAGLRAQKFGYVDTEYILKKVPAYKSAQDQLDKLSAQYQKEVESKYKAVDDLFKKYQSEKVLLTEDMRQKRENEIVTREKEVKELQKTYFSPEGSLAKKREELLKPVQDKVYTAIKDIASDGSYATIFDVANNPGMIYNNPRFDLSDKVLEKMGI
jgi:outer membrane protein